ncbi:MAG: aspartate/glutamate racemase family protein [Spirochaetes bacterium]|nr:aspartate/glutamate racemase family protein [Spirochaetota bacterium]
MRERVIVIGGGVGPMAGVALHARIIENTLTDGSDQSHLDVHHYSRSSDIPDRTDWLLGKTADDPVEGMVRTFMAADDALQRSGREAVGGVPCNTFHAPAIFDRFLRRLEEEGIGIRVLNMLDESIALLGMLAPCARAIGILSTTGTRMSGVYDRLLERNGMRSVLVSDADQARLHEAIYDRVWGLKAANPPSERAVAVTRELAESLAAQGAEATLLACTELPLAIPDGNVAGVPCVDPVLALARALIREAAPGKLKALGAP